MTGYDEAVAWFRERTGSVDDIEVGAAGPETRRHAATIVRAALTEAVPAGRDLTAQDVTEMLERFGAAGPKRRMADVLNHIARPARDVHDDQDRIPTAVEIVDEMERAREAARPAGDDTTEAGPRSWSLPVPPPDDVTVVHVGGVRYPLDTPPGDPEPIFTGPDETQYGWYELLAVGTVVKGEPPAPEPEYAVSNWVRVPTTDGDTVTVGAPALDRRPHPESRWDTRTETWEPAPEPQAAEPDQCRYCPNDADRDEAGFLHCIECGWTDNPGKVVGLHETIDRLRAELAEARVELVAVREERGKYGKGWRAAQVELAETRDRRDYLQGQLDIIYDAEYSRNDALKRRIEKLGAAGDALFAAGRGLYDEHKWPDEDLSPVEQAYVDAEAAWRSVRGYAPTEPPAAGVSVPQKSTESPDGDQ